MTSTINRGAAWSRMRRIALAFVLLGVAIGLAPGHAGASGHATFQDDAHLFSSARQSRIDAEAARAGLRVFVVTTRQPFAARTDFRHWLRGLSQDRGGVTIGLHAVHRTVDVVVGPDTHLSLVDAQSGLKQTLPLFNAGRLTDGVVQLIVRYHAAGATSSTASVPGAGNTHSGIGWLLPLVAVLAIVFVLARALGRRRVQPGYGPTGMAGTYGAPGPMGQGFGGGLGPGLSRGAGGGFLSGMLGGLGGAWIGNQLFGNRGGGDAGAAGSGPDPNASSGAPDAPDLQGGWTGDVQGWDGAGGAVGGDVSSTDAGGWSDSGGGGDWTGSGGDSGGWS